MSADWTIDLTLTFPRSPRLFMQFMEPLGTTDSSVDAAWDFVTKRWKPRFVEVVRDLAPGCIRWGGCYTSYWKWREGVGPYEARVPAHNFLWHGMDWNHVGIHEIVDLCRRVGAEPLVGINFAADGRPEYLDPPVGPSRAGDAAEAADLVSYCNDPDNRERRGNGQSDPWGVRLWQVGNETSYPPAGRRFTSEENTANYIEFAAAMRKRDPSIELIGWGDRARGEDTMWAADLLEGAGELVDYVAVHMMNQHPQYPDSILIGREYMTDRARAWDELQVIYAAVETKLNDIIRVVDDAGSNARIAITEGHLSLKPRNTSLLLYEWLAGLYHARVMNLFERNADRIELSTLADFFGNRWSVNAVMLGSPSEPVYLMPAGTIMKVFGRLSGEQGVRVDPQAGSLDISASRSSDALYLHVVNCDLDRGEDAVFRLAGAANAQATVHEIAPGDLAAYVDAGHTSTFEPVPRNAEVRDGRLSWRFPPASVSVVEVPLS